MPGGAEERVAGTETATGPAASLTMASRRPPAHHAIDRSFIARKATPLAILRCQPADSRRLFRCLEAHLPKSPSNLRCQIIGTPVAA